VLVLRLLEGRRPPLASTRLAAAPTRLAAAAWPRRGPLRRARLALGYLINYVFMSFSFLHYAAEAKKDPVLGYYNK